MNFTLKIWRQKDAKSKGAFETYKVENISADTSFLEMLDILNNNLIHEGKEPVAFDHDCREAFQAGQVFSVKPDHTDQNPLQPHHFLYLYSCICLRSLLRLRRYNFMKLSEVDQCAFNTTIITAPRTSSRYYYDIKPTPEFFF